LTCRYGFGQQGFEEFTEEAAGLVADDVEAGKLQLPLVY